MELPPLSPGIQDSVMDVVVVLVTVRRGWSGGTERVTLWETDKSEKVFFMVHFTQLTLHLQVQRYFISAPVIAGDTRVIPRILSFHSLDDEATVSVDASPSIGDGRAWAPTDKIHTKEWHFLVVWLLCFMSFICDLEEFFFLLFQLSVLPFLHPFDCWWWISYSPAGQDNVSHPGCGHCATKSEDPGRSCLTQKHHSP